jgi:TldD protein
MERRDFLKLSAISGTALLFPDVLTSKAQTPPPAADIKKLTAMALNTAKSKRAQYADIRIALYRNQSINTREDRVLNISDTESYGFGVRVLVDGTWGFASSNRVDEREVGNITLAAVAIAKANKRLQKEPVQLAPVPAYKDTWKTPMKKNPFDVPVKEKVEFLLALNQEALRVKGATFCNSSMFFASEHKFFASTDGSFIEQEIIRAYPVSSVTSVDRTSGKFESRRSYASPISMGYEYIEDFPWLDEIRRAAEDAVAKHSAKSVEAGKHDLILHPTHLWLTIHESVGHPTEFDRALGYEANYAGTSFLTLDKLNKLQFGSPIVNFIADKTYPGGLATCGYDDDGVKTKEWHLVKDGIFVDYQTIRDQAHILGKTESDGCCYADHWSSVPFQRMPNVSLQPGMKQLSLDDLVADTERGILIKGDSSFSIDHQRYNFQFNGQTAWEIQNGKIVGMLRDVAYQANTVEFWNSCDAICSKEEFWLGGAMNDGKGQPGQSNGVSHGCPSARFRQVNVLNTSKTI